ncbi:patatin-like phospholipase family protein [Alphaproteobacteria bacterium KMM 3653]|uniref:Patatin-like phospholipase family protein n=1 Tax=Harenicola maris TaxID=2841044 RepID=A0AAP2G2U4_9RHOB|nr:patatin-like phospholipase family protein [Harenicola maris]
MPHPNTPNRRHILAGLAALPLAACAAPIAKLSAPDPSGPDPLAKFRLPARATTAQWQTHLHAPSLARGPNVLALSGGGEDGAFSAGALNGWTGRGTRPAFDMVTGVSTGALIAPFAFLGSDYDATLREIFTEHDAADIMRFRGLQILASDALYDTSPLANLIKAYTPPQVMQAIARRHDAGARLFAVTANLETSRGVVWNMGALAKAGLYDLFRGIMRASSALPGLFPPVTLQFDAGGETFRETHIDGGVQMQFLAMPQAAFTAPRRAANGGHIYVLINNTLTPEPSAVAHTPLAISQQALTTMIRSSAAISLRSTRLLARENNLGFSFASVAPEVGATFDPAERFASDYMRRLYNHGLDRMTQGTLWGS